MSTKFTAFHWPDHVIGKRESRRIREDHNALYNSHAEILNALDNLLDACLHWQDQDDPVLVAGREAIKKVQS